MDPSPSYLPALVDYFYELGYRVVWTRGLRQVGWVDPGELLVVLDEDRSDEHLEAFLWGSRAALEAPRCHQPAS